MILLPGTAGRAELHVDVEHALGQLRPADAAGPRQGGLDLPFGGVCGLGALFCLSLAALKPPVVNDASRPKAAAPEE